MKNLEVNDFFRGFRDGIPIGIGYISVSFAFGMMAVKQGLPIWSAVLISFTNLTSAGQFAGIGLISAGASLIEVVFTQVIINIRYALMSMSVSQKSDDSMTTFHRFIISFFVTDEIFAVACGNKDSLSRRYMYGVGIIPIIGWTLGTLLGATAGTALPNELRSALGLAVYGMFVAIIVPPAKHFQGIRVALIFSVILSCILNFTPVLNRISAGFIIIICAAVVSSLCAKLFPIKEKDS